MNEQEKPLLKVLIIEDSEDDAFLVSDELLQGGYELELRRVENAAQVRQALAKTVWDVILADYKLPNFSGLDAFEIYKEAGLDTPFIIISGSMGEDLAVAAMKAGVHDYLTKDKLARLVPAVQREIREAQVRRERLRAERELAASNRLLANVLRAIPDAFIRLDAEWRYVYANSRAAEFLGNPVVDLTGRSIREVSLKSLGASMEAEVRRARERQEPVHIEELSPTLRRWLETDVYPSEDGITILSRDITERKQFEENLRQTQKLESVGLLAGGVAHDFNNLLTGIMGNASLAMDAVPSDHETASLLKNVVDGAERASHLTRQLLAYAGKGRLVVEPIDLTHTVRRFTDLLRTSIPKKVNLQFDFEPRLPHVVADVGQIQQVVMNLVMNAAEAIGDSSGTVTISTRMQGIDRPSQVQNLTHEEPAIGQYVVLEIRDTGSGMDEATKTKIFDPFFTTKFTGRGLGLAATLGIIRGHKGVIEVESAPGQGSTIRVWFPTVAAPEAVVRKEIRRADLRGTGKVLIVDDEPDIRRYAQGVLERLGYDVISAQNGQDALERIRANGDISIVLLNVTMPVMSGPEALAHVKNLQPDAKVLISSGYSESDLIRRLMEEGAAGFLPKPYTAEQLGAKVKELLTARFLTAGGGVAPFQE